MKELQSIGLDVEVRSEDGQKILIRDSDDDVHETAKELDLPIGESRYQPVPRERKTPRFAEKTNDADVDAVADFLEDGESVEDEPLMGMTEFEITPQVKVEDEVDLRARKGVKKAKTKEKKINPRALLEEVDDLDLDDPGQDDDSLD